MGLLVDIVVGLAFVLCLIGGVRRGAARSLAGLVGFVAALFLAPQVGAWLMGLWPVPGPVDRFLLSLLCTALAFAAICAVAGLVGRLLDLVCQLPVLHLLNRVLGGVVGAAKGLVLAFVMAALLQLLLPTLSAKYPQQVRQQDYQNSVVLKLSDAGLDDDKQAQVWNPVYAFYERILREGVQIHADQK